MSGPLAPPAGDAGGAPIAVLLAGSWDAPEAAQWAEALQSAIDGLAADSGPRLRLVRQREAGPADAIEAAVVANPPAGALAGLPRLRFVQSLWAGVDRLLADPTVPPQLPIARMVDPAMNQAMAETALWATLSLHRGFFRYARQQAEGRWAPLAQWRADEVPVLVLGGGQMGAAAAASIARQGYPVTVWRRSAAGQPPAGCRAVWGEAGLHAALPQARVLINLLPLTPATHGLLGAPLFDRLPVGAGLVNLARGAHLVQADLLAALASGRIGEAVLDVFETEPLPADHPFWRHPQVAVLPHAAAQTDARSAARIAVENLARWAQGRPPHHLVQRAAGY